ncbi:ATP-dependent DNA helicase sgs1 [Mortierella sp. AD010]|nr:ATP-dependent DNA helicase sgs1 [Mortierella sp. AD010]
MFKFVKGDIDVLLATEAAGMGCDIPDVVQVIQYGDMPSLVQRFGRAARDPKIQGFGILYAPPITKMSPTDENVRESGNRGRWPSRSEEEKNEALKTLLAWRKEAYGRWVSCRPFRTGRETWILPDNAAKQLSQRFSQARTAEAVKTIASSCNWSPLGGSVRFDEVAQVLDKLNSEIDARRGSGSQTTTASALDQLEDDSDGGGERSDGEEDLPGSASDSLAAARVIDQPLGNQAPSTD